MFMHHLAPLNLSGMKGEEYLFEILTEMPTGPGATKDFDEMPPQASLHRIIYEIPSLGDAVRRFIIGRYAQATPEGDLLLIESEGMVYIGGDAYYCYMGIVRLPMRNIINSF